jgi:Family of unknown function (DUF5684)
MLLAANAGLGIGVGFFALLIAVIVIAGLWKTFDKAGVPGWWAIIPILNLYGILKVAGRPAWWLLLFLIPCIDIIIALVVFIDVAQRFGKGMGFAIGLWILPFVFFLILGFGSATYRSTPEELYGA